MTDQATSLPAPADSYSIRRCRCGEAMVPDRSGRRRWVCPGCHRVER